MIYTFTLDRAETLQRSFNVMPVYKQIPLKVPTVQVVAR